MSREETVLRVTGVSKNYENGQQYLEVLRDVSFSVQRNEITAVTGESGSGKSTMLNIVGGLDRPDTGTVEVLGRSLFNLNEDEMCTYRGYTVGFIFQLHHLLKDFTALENVALPAMMTGVKRREAYGRSRELLDDVGLFSRSDHYPYQLSGGERQRVAVARALVNRPDLVLADEPTGNLDEESSRHVEDLLFSIVSGAGKALLIVTHDKGIAERAGTRYVLHRGTIKADV